MNSIKPSRHPDKWWVSTPAFTVRVETNESGKIVMAAPIVKRFKGQHFDNLRNWVLKKWPGKVSISGAS